LSIIIPTRQFSESLAARIEGHRRLFPEAEIIVVEPSDLPPLDDEPLETTATPAGVGIQRLRAARGRGTQCNAGAARATGLLLLFLHDDTALPVEAPALVQDAFADPRTQLACFWLRFDHAHWLLASYAFFSRFDSSLTSFGDQGILIRRAFFGAIGGFPDWPLFEDVDLLSRARRRTRIKKLPAAVTTSAVRFLENGILRQQLLNAELMLRYSLGASPESLRRRYERQRGSDPLRDQQHQ
jgi:rSAM/selenodomain-associated transferase 2